MKWTLKRFFILFFVCILSLHAEKLEITADKFTAKDADKKVSFIGNAKIVQGSTTVKAPQIILYFDENNTTKMYRATGRVRFHIKKTKTNYKGSCDSMEYLPKKKKYILIGNIKVIDVYNKREITASRIEINSMTGAFSIEGSRKKAAKLTFDMK
ncbi:MAG: lipopolysaccharide transport periplasmic protein LptA [Sulfurovum sp.]|nr:lipopolysaccharide transport periplasmic protein LptA [Sulfurovum sp.]